MRFFNFFSTISSSLNFYFKLTGTGDGISKGVEGFSVSDSNID